MNDMFGISNLMWGDVAPFQGLGYNIYITQGGALCWNIAPFQGLRNIFFINREVPVAGVLRPFRA